MSKYIGAISGTSMDGIDTAIVDFADDKPTVIGSLCVEYPEDLRQQLQILCEPSFDEINRLGEADIIVGELFAEAINDLLDQTDTQPEEITAIGSHGQTIRHKPHAQRPFTIQIGCPNVISERTGITTVADFRRRDIALGGQGAPLTPAFHEWMFRSDKEDRVVLNIGGIANASFLPADQQQEIRGFDTGPGNALLDTWMQQHHKKPYDTNGMWAASGDSNAHLLELLMADPYFYLPPPKSTGKEYFNMLWLDRCLQSFGSQLPAEDIQATLLDLTTLSIAKAITTYGPEEGSLIVCGGGAYNQTLMENMSSELEEYQVLTSEEFGIAPDWVEAIAFAWFAKKRMEMQAINLSTITGSHKPVLLGGIYNACG